MTDIILTKITELKELISRFSHKSFIAHICWLSNIKIRQSKPSNLTSPIRQLMYLINLYHTSDFEGNKLYSFNNKNHDRIIKLLNEIELEYITNAFSSSVKLSQEHTIVAHTTFFNYYLNSPLSFIEQDTERIKTTFQHFERFISAQTALELNDFLHFFLLLTDLELSYARKCVGKKIDSKNSVYNLAIPISEIHKGIGKEKAKILLTIFTLSRSTTEFLYYTDPCKYLRQPIIQMGDSHIIMLYSKQLIRAIYEFLFELCSNETAPGRKISERRDEYLEKKTSEVFSNFFDNDAQIYSSYYINSNEKDLLVLAGTSAFIIECKANKYRPPFRDTLKAYHRINDDFKKCIGKAYLQAKEVEDCFNGEQAFTIKDKIKRVHTSINPKNYKNVFTIVVTQERFGQIQCDLAYLLPKESQDNYPWAVCLDDLESFLITLKRKKNYLNEFNTFLLERKKLHGKVFCDDELDLCASFLFAQEDFITICRRNETACFTARNEFDALYKIGFGFKDELHLSEKIKVIDIEAASIVKYHGLKLAKRVQNFSFTSLPELV